MVGFDTSDDAAVYRVSDELAMIQTVDFFPPVVDDPFAFGQIAAANALSDVYAMGGTPKLAMNLLCFSSCLPLDVVKEILAGGYSKVKEAGAIIAGGHTIDDKEPKYGLCVTGFAHPDEILTNAGAQPGDLLVLTKPLGSGILSTAAMAELLTPDEVRQMTATMSELNAKASDIMTPFHPHACTDVTGFGLLGHAREMAAGSGLTVEIRASAVPVRPKAIELAREGIIPAGAYRNMSYLEDGVSVAPGVPTELSDALYDPQTSGGLLIALPEERAKELVMRLESETPCGTIIGEVKPFGGKDVLVK